MNITPITLSILVLLLSLSLSFHGVSGTRKAKKPHLDKQLGQVRVLLLAPGYPWQFGAYQNQQALLGVELLRRGFDVYWNSAFRQLGGSTKAYTSPLDVIKADDTTHKPPTPKGKQLKRAKLFTYIGVPLPPAYQSLGRGVLASAVNAQLTKHSIDAIICLMDANQIFMDTPFDAYSLMWFPNHFSSLNMPQESVLRKFDVVASLAPTDAEMIRQEKYQLKRVEVIPHIIEKPSSLSNSSLKVLRKKYQIPPKAWVVFVNCGNYEKNNRKSLDTILLAFQALLAEVPEAFLYLKTVSGREIMMSEGHPRDMKMEEFGLPIQDLLAAIPLPPSSYTHNTAVSDATTVWEILSISNVLLMPSKSEGFGLPMLEAQLMGVPVVTTRFGAMKDYTINGISVPPSQPVFMTAGLAVMPDLHGVISALKAVHTDSLPSTLTNTAVEFITQNLSSSAVGQQFETLINDGVAARAVDGIFRRSVSAAGPSFTPSHAAPTGRGGNGDYGSNSDDFFYSLEYQSAERYRDLLTLPPEDVPGWVLLWSNVSTLDFKALDNIRRQGWGTTTPPSEGDVLFLLTKKADGSTFPRESDLQQGTLDPDIVVLVRSDRLIPAGKFLDIEAATGRSTPTAHDALRASLAQTVRIDRPINMKVIHIVVATVKEEEERRKTQIMGE